MKKRFKSLWFQLFLVGVLLMVVHKILNDGTAISAFFNRIYAVFRPFLVGGFIALFLYKPCSFLEKKFRKHPNRFIFGHATGLGVAVVYTVLAIGIWLSLQVVLPGLIENIQLLLMGLPAYYEEGISFLEQNAFFASMNLSEKTAPFLEQLLSAEALGRYMAYLSNMASSLLSVLTGIVISIYMLLEKNTLVCVWKRLVFLLVRKTDRHAVFSHFKKLGNLFYSYFTGLGLDALLVGAFSIVLFYAFGVPYAFLFGVFSGFCNLIPFFGPIFAAGVIFLLSFLSLGFGRAIWILVLQVLLGQIDANVIQPKIVGHSVGISPFWVIFSVLVFGELWGVLGMIFGVPIVAVARFWFFELEELRYQ